MFPLQRFVTCLNDVELSKYLLGYRGRNITTIIITRWFRWDDTNLVKYPRHALTFGWRYADAESSKSSFYITVVDKKRQALSNFGKKAINGRYETKHKLILRARTIITNISGSGLRVIKFQSRNVIYFFLFFFSIHYLTFR
jgi:hypothetical protein